jgi:hypothetical protein
MSAIEAYRTQILALLTDAGSTYFSSTDVDQALRWALAEYSNRRPLLRTYQYTVMGVTSHHEMPTGFVTQHITGVQRPTTSDDELQEIPFHASQRDETWIIETTYDMPDGTVLQITYSDVHQVDGLDGAAGTTVPDGDETLLCVGTAGHAMQQRAMDRVETINMNQDVRQNYMEIAVVYLAAFNRGILPEAGTVISLPTFPGDEELKF